MVSPDPSSDRISPSLIRVGFSKASQGYSFEPLFGECERSSLARKVRVWPRPVLGLIVFFLLIIILLKTGSVPWIYFKYLAWQPPERKSDLFVSASDWPKS